tara:strand:- start:350 stop:955 length:606 start_codon:yes stop_codon:yes gene_type:complete
MARVDSTGGAGYVIDNGTGAAVRTKLNQITAAINSTNSGSGDPSINTAYQQHIDTASGLWKIRNGANNAYISLGDITAADLGHMPKSGGTFTGAITHNYTSALKIPVGTTAQRPGSPSTGQFRWNSTTGSAEIYDGSAFSAVGGGGGATGTGSDAIFLNYGQTVTGSYSIPASTNSLSAGPIAIASGQSVTIPSGSRWVIV